MTGAQFAFSGQPAASADRGRTVQAKSARLLQAFKVRNQGDLVLGGELDIVVLVTLGHFVARLDRARIVNPPVQLLPIVFEQAGGDRGARSDVRQVGGGYALGAVAADRVAGNTCLGREQRLPLHHEFRVFVLFRCLLALPSLQRLKIELIGDTHFVAFEGAQAGKLRFRAVRHGRAETEQDIH